MATLLAVQVRECEGCQAPNNSASTAHSSNWYRLILFSIITYYSTIQLFPPGPDKAPLWEWLERWRPGPIQWPWPHQWIRYHLNHLMVTVVKSMEIGPKYGALLIEIYRPVVQVSRSLRLRRQLQKWKGMSGCWARRCIPAPLGGKASMQHATGTQDPNEMSMSTRLDCIETYWNILKHIETYWNILKHIETSRVPIVDRCILSWATSDCNEAYFEKFGSQGTRPRVESDISADCHGQVPVLRSWFSPVEFSTHF